MFRVSRRKSETPMIVSSGFLSTETPQGMASLYTNDGMLLPPGADVQSGKQAIQAFWQMVMDMGVKTARLETLEVEDNGEIAIEVGRYNLRGAEGQVIDHGKYIVAWKKDMGQWKLSRDIWNTSIVS